MPAVPDAVARRLPPFYLVSDRKATGARSLEEAVAAALDGGCRMLQLREKDLPAAELLPLAERLRRLTEPYGALLLINDRIDIALACDADGVHLGGHSLPARVARRLLGPKRLVGVSTHNLAELQGANEGGADFATFGPVFATPSKLPLGDPVGPAALETACQTSTLPIYALGGITSANLHLLKSSGAAGVACIRAVLAANDPGSACADLLNAWQG